MKEHACVFFYGCVIQTARLWCNIMSSTVSADEKAAWQEGEGMKSKYSAQLNDKDVKIIA